MVFLGQRFGVGLIIGGTILTLLPIVDALLSPPCTGWGCGGGGYFVPCCGGPALILSGIVVLLRASRRDETLSSGGRSGWMVSLLDPLERLGYLGGVLLLAIGLILMAWVVASFGVMGAIAWSIVLFPYSCAWTALVLIPIALGIHVLLRTRRRRRMVM